MAETTDHPVLSANFTEALAYTRMLHRDQVRKDTGGVPYMSHLMGTAALLLEDGGSEDEAIAALLHDALEDQAHRTSEDQIAEMFGAHVAEIVVACSDREPGEDLSWRERKERYLASIGKKSACALRVSNADKLHNARTILDDLHQHGDDLWRRFQRPGQELEDTIRNQLWYYTSLAVEFHRHNPGQLSDTLARTVLDLETLEDARRALVPLDDRLDQAIERWPTDPPNE